jgi:DNA-binding MarR family transcriptional regulator
MRSQDEHTPVDETATYRELRAISEVESNPEITQRDLAQKLGVALGLTNVLLKNMAQRGYVRVTKMKWNRWIYTVTPRGFTRKVQLTVTYIRRTLDHYGNIRQTLREELAPLALNRESRIALCGTGEFAELVYLGLKEQGIEEIEVFSHEYTSGSNFLGIPVQPLESLQPNEFDRVIFGILDEQTPQEIHRLENDLDESKVVVFFRNQHTNQHNNGRAR